MRVAVQVTHRMPPKVQMIMSTALRLLLESTTEQWPAVSNFCDESKKEFRNSMLNLDEVTSLKLINSDLTCTPFQTLEFRILRKLS